MLMRNKELFPILSLNQSCYFDLLRFFAVQLVVIGHLFGFMNIVVSPHFALGINIPIQNLGVVIFFILSGYLIAYSVHNNLRAGKYHFKDFFKDRFFRIYVTLIPCISLVAILDNIMPHYQYSGAYNIKTFMGNLFMLQDISYCFAGFFDWSHLTNLLLQFQITSFGSARPLWTLAIEWWLYMAFGWFILMLVNRPTTPKIKKSTSLFIFCLLLIVPIYHLIGRGNGLTVTWLSGALIFYGVYSQMITLSLSPRSWLKGNLICCCLLYYVYFRLGTFYDLRISILVAIWFALNLACANKVPLPNSNNLIRIIRIAGGYSYALYLIHYSVIQLLVNVYGIIDNKITVTLAAFILSNAAALCIYFIFDRNHKKIQACFFAPFSRYDFKYNWTLQIKKQ